MDEFLAKPIRAADLWAAIERIMGACPPAEPTGLLDPRVLLAACGGDAAILENICQAFRACLPGHLKAVQDALRDRDAPGCAKSLTSCAGWWRRFPPWPVAWHRNWKTVRPKARSKKPSPSLSKSIQCPVSLMRLADGLSLETLRHQSV